MSGVTTYPKALLRLLPFVGGGDALPDDELVREGVEVDRGHLGAYQRVCGFRLSDRLPATYPHMIAFPLSMELMTRMSFPFGVIGLVHVANRVEQIRLLEAGEALDVRVRTADLRPHERGRQFDVVAEASAAGEVAWRSVSTYLHREGGAGERGPASERAAPPSATAFWKVPGDIGRRYARVSGDANPIHLHPLGGRLFGFPRAIAHGMWVKARCLAALEPALPTEYAAEVRFKLPMPIPAKVAFASWEQDGGRGFAVHDARSGRPHLSGSVT
jgi:acyl dehydratase